MLFDTHTHLNDPQFDSILGATVDRAVEHGVEHMIVVGIDLESSRRAVAVAGQYTRISAAVGIQPNYCAQVTDAEWNEIKSLSEDNNVVAIGETGLDRYWDYCPMDIQRDYFRKHMEFSRESGLPFIVHMRDCNDDIVEFFGDQASDVQLNGVMHSFTGDLPMALTCLDYGLMISFAGMVTFKKSTELREVARQIPLDRLLIETDCPYLSPHPKRGQRPNEPALLIHTAECLAEVKGISLKDLCQATTENAKRFFGVQ